MDLFAGISAIIYHLSVSVFVSETFTYLLTRSLTNLQKYLFANEKQT